MSTPFPDARCWGGATAANQLEGGCDADGDVIAGNGANPAGG